MASCLDSDSLFLFLPSVYTAAFAGVKYIFTQIGAGEAIGLTSFVTVLIVLCAYTILFGRFFCGFACAFGSLGDGIHAFISGALRRERKSRCYFRKDHREVKLFEISGVDRNRSTCFAGVYGKAKGTSPWDVFFYAACRKSSLAGIFAGSDITTSYYCGDVSGRKIFLSESVSDGSSILITSGASVLCIAPRQRIASKAAADARRNVHPGSDSRKTDHSKSREIVSNARNVLILVQRSISIQESKV